MAIEKVLHGVSSEKAETSSNELDLTHTTTQETIVEGTTQLYSKSGHVKYIPMPTADPKDPLNMTDRQKVLAIVSVCLFGAMSGAAESIIAALMPVFVFEYNGLDPHYLTALRGLPASRDGTVNPNPAGALGFFTGGPPLWRIYLLSSLPVLVIGICNYIFVPLSIAVGRRPVLLAVGLMAWVGAIWAGFSNSLDAHLAARCLQALGAGTVDSLIPLIVQDMVFIHWRNRAISFIWASQGLIVVSLGVGSPRIVHNLTWRWVYWITAAMAVATWVMCILFVPETKRLRSSAELRGESPTPLPEGVYRPALDPGTYGEKTFWTDVRLFSVEHDWRGCWESMIATARSLFFPNVMAIVLVQGIFIAIVIGAGQTASPVLLTEPNSWPFVNLGYSVFAIFIACPIVWLFSGYLADRISNWITKRKGGRREPEYHLVNLILPIFTIVLGCVLFGLGGSYPARVGWAPFVVGIGLIAFGGLSFNAIMAVYVIESFPEWAGPVIVNVSSFRNILGFAFSFRVVDWVVDRGYLGCFGIYAACVALGSIVGLTSIFIWGKKWRAKAGRVIRKKGFSNLQA